MTERVKGLVVTFSNDIRIDDVQVLVDAISMFKGVASVKPNISTPSDHINQERIRYELKEKFYKFIEENFE